MRASASSALKARAACTSGGGAPVGPAVDAPVDDVHRLAEAHHLAQAREPPLVPQLDELPAWPP